MVLSLKVYKKEQLDLKLQIKENCKQGDMVMDDVRIVGVDIPFIDLVLLLVKLAIAAIPAAIIIGVIWTVIGGFLFGFLNHI